MKFHVYKKEKWLRKKNNKMSGNTQVTDAVRIDTLLAILNSKQKYKNVWNLSEPRTVIEKVNVYYLPCSS